MACMDAEEDEKLNVGAISDFTLMYYLKGRNF